MKFEPRQPQENVNVSKTNPLREAAVLIGGILTLSALFLLVAAFFIDLLVPHIPHSWERRISDFIASAGAPAGENREESAALEGLLKRLASHWPEIPYDVRIGILESEHPNALAFPGGQILVTTALLEQAESENELAFVIGHELGHFRNRDHLRGLGRGIAFGLLIAIVQGGGGTAGEAITLVNHLSTRKFSRDQERAADRFALELVYQEYGHVGSAWDFFRKLPPPEGKIDQTLQTYLSTHPVSADRIRELESLARRKGWPTKGEVVPPGESPKDAK